MRAIEICLRETGGAQAVLVGNHHQSVAGFLQRQQRRDHIRLQRQLVHTVYLEILRGFADKRAIAIDKQDFLIHRDSVLDEDAGASAFNAATTLWHSTSVPMVIRRQSANPGCLL